MGTNTTSTTTRPCEAVCRYERRHGNQGLWEPLECTRCGATHPAYTADEIDTRRAE